MEVEHRGDAALGFDVQHCKQNGNLKFKFGLSLDPVAPNFSLYSRELSLGFRKGPGRMVRSRVHGKEK